MSRKTRKLIWSAPLVAVLAVAGALAMFAAQGTGNVFANPLPDAPMNLTVEPAEDAAGRTTLVLNWDAAANAAGYRIDISDQGAVWETMTMDTGSTATTYTDDTLTASDTRWYRVFAVNSHGIGPVSNAVSGTTDEKVNPGSVMNLTAMPNADKPRTRLDLSWDAPAMDGGEMIVGYEIQAHVDGNWIAVAPDTPASPVADNVTVVTKTSYMDATDREPGDTQRYRVRAVNGTAALTADGETAMSADDDASKQWVQATGTTAAAAPPGQVTGLTAVNATDASINLYWYDPEDTGGWLITGYVIQAHRQGKKFPSAPNDAAIKAATFVGADSPPVLGGEDTAANPDNATWYQTKADAGNVQASFTGILGRGTPAVQQRWYFRVYAVTTDNATDAAVTDDIFRRSARPSNTASDTPAARAIDHDGDADRTDGVGPTATLDPLAAPTITPTGPTNTPPDAKKQQIDLGLALNAAIVTNNALTEAQGRVAKTPVEQIAYRIDYSKNAGLSWKPLVADTRFTGFSATKPYEDDDGLAYDESRSYRVFAIGQSSTDVGLPSDLVTGATAASTAPKKPTGVMASSPSLTSIMASWTAPEDNGGQDIVKYYYQYVQDDDDGVAEAEDFDATSNDNLTGDAPGGTTSDAMTMHTFTKLTLTMETVYVFRVAAANTDPANNDADRPTGPGDTTNVPNWSDPVLFNTSEAAKPNAVEGLTSELATDASGNNRGVNLLWNKPSDKIAITDYDVEIQDEDGDWVNPTGGEDLSPNRTSYTDSEEYTAEDMAAGVVRKYRVRAENGVGEGPWTMVYFPRGPAADYMHVTAVTPNPLMAEPVAVGMMETVDVAPGFTSDPAGVMVSYTADSDDDAIATASVAGSMVTITGVADGSTTVTVTATVLGDEATQDIAVTVIDVPGAPTDLSAMKNADMPTSQIDLSWTAPADNGGSAVTHYIIERRYEGDMMGDIPSDGYNDAVNGASFAFSDHKGWWETLNCKGMLRVFGSDADPTMDSDDKSMYCAHYAMSGPTADMTFENPIADGSDLDMKIEALFDKRYVITSDAMTTHSDTGLMAATEYTYRVSAVNMAGRSPWSEADMATTDSGNSDPMPVGTITVDPLRAGETSDAITLGDYFSDADGDTLMYTVAVMPDDDSIATAMITEDDSDPGATVHMLTITGVAEGMATITVTATDPAGATAMQTIDVEVTRGALTPPETVMASHTGVQVTVTWAGGMNADTFAVAMIRQDAEGNWDIPNAVYDTGVTGSPHEVNMATRPAGTYHVFVIAGSTDDGWSNWVSGMLNYAP